MSMSTPRARILCILVPAVVLAVARSEAAEPGVDTASPRFALSTVDGLTTVFHPNLLTIEQGDWVRWVWQGGSHTTTSGPACTANGLWSQALNSLTPPTFTRQFTDPPGLFPFFCSPHCLTFGMRGQVTVTTLIDVSAKDSTGMLTLGWNGGGGSYQVFRSDNPAFVGVNTVTLSPDGGSTGTTFTDFTTPPAGQASFYLVMNL